MDITERKSKFRLYKKGSDELRIAKIDCFIPDAMAYANERCGLKKGDRCSDALADEWNHYYMTKMTEFTVGAGLRIA